MSNLVPKDEFKSRLLEIIDEVVKVDKKIAKFKDVLLDQNNFGDNYHSTPGNISYLIKSKGETAFQRALLNSCITFLDYKRGTPLERVAWLDGELPLVLNKNSRRVSLDLIGVLDGIPAICELKYLTKSSKSDSPYYAAIELLVYKCLIQYNFENLEKNKIMHKNAKQFTWKMFEINPFPETIVCANKSYWDYWFTRFLRKDVITDVYNIGRLLDTNIRLFQSKDYKFENTTGESQYTPIIHENIVFEMVVNG